MGVLPGQKFVWLKAKSDPGVAADSILINTKYLSLLKIPEKELVEVIYEGQLLFKAKLETRADAPKGFVLISRSRMEEFKVPENEPVIVAELREKVEGS